MPPTRPRDDFEGIGERIKRYREEAGLSLTALATKAGVSKSYLHRLESESGDVRPSGKTLYMVAQALGVTMSDLLGRKLLVSRPTGVPAALQKLAEEDDLPESDIEMLASIEFRGEAPRTVQRWRYIYNAIETSRGLDRQRRK